MIPDRIEIQDFNYTGSNIRLKTSKEANEAKVHNSKVEQELRTLPEHLSSSPVSMGFVLLDMCIVL